MNEISFQSTRIPFNSKKFLMDYVNALPPKDFKSFHNRSVEDCLYDLRHTDNNMGILFGKDRCFYIFGNSVSQDKNIYSRLKKVDSNVTYIKDVPSI